MHGDAITRLPDPSGIAPDALIGVIRAGAREHFGQAIEAELAARLVRHGSLPERGVLTGIGPVAVKVPRLRDRGTGEDKISFPPGILPRYLRKAKSIEELLPWLYLKGEPRDHAQRRCHRHLSQR